MQDLVNSITGVFDQLNPFNPGNLILYFGWLVVFTFTTVAIWRSPSAWFRLLCFVVNQLVSVGILLSWTLTALLAYSYWQASLATLIGIGFLSLMLFRRRRQRAELAAARGVMPEPRGRRRERERAEPELPPRRIGPQIDRDPGNERSL